VQPTTRVVDRGTVGLEGASRDTYAGDPVSASGIPTPAEYCLFTSIGPKLMTRLLVEKTRSSTLPQKKIYILIRSRISPKIVRWTFLLFVFTIPFEYLDLEAIRGVSSLARIAGLLCFSTCLFYSKVCFRRPPQALWWFAGYVFVYVLMGLLTPEKVAGQFIGGVQTLIQLLVLCWISFTLLQEEKFARHILLTFSIATLLSATGMLLGLPGFVAQAGEGRLSAMGFNPNGLAYIMGMAAQALIGFGIDHTSRKRWKRVTFLVLSLLPLMAMVYTGSRGGILASMTGITIYALPYCRSKRKVMATLGIAMVVVGVIYLVLNDQSTKLRFERSYEQGDMAGRNNIFAAAVEMVSEKPLLGWGNMAGPELGSRTGKWSRDTHNLFLHLLTMTGLLGTIPFLIGLGLCVRAAWTARVCSLGLLPLAWLVTIMVVSMSGTPIADKLLWLALALSLASEAFTVKQRMRKNLLIKTILQLSPKSHIVHTT
jgi:O-antigen ligase